MNIFSFYWTFRNSVLFYYLVFNILLSRKQPTGYRPLNYLIYKCNFLSWLHCNDKQSDKIKDNKLISTIIKMYNTLIQITELLQKAEERTLEMY